MQQQKVAETLARPAISIVELVDAIVEQAHTRGASDIHIDPGREDLRMRLRIDEHQTTQDGRFRHNFTNGETLDMRVSIDPTYHGENVVLHLLSDNAASYTLHMLGFSECDREKILTAIKRPHGMILSTGPTGSGKTTTLYTLIKMLNSPEV